MSFDNIASSYGFLESICAGKLLHRCRVHHLPDVRPPQHILILGEGHGRFLGICEQQFPEALITVIDSSEEMIAITHEKHPTTTAQFLHTDVLCWKPEPASYDLIVSHFFLDCFTKTQLAKIIEMLSHAATTGAQWLVADFETPKKGIPKWRARLILCLLYRFFNTLTQISAITLTPADPYLIKHGFRLTERRVFDWGLLKSELWQR